MKTKLLLILLCFLSVSFANAQMSVSTNQNTVTFTFDDANDTSEWDVNGNPFYLYAFIETADASNSVFSNPLGVWPGTAMANQGNDIYVASFDLLDFYPSGTLITDIKYIFNNNNYNNSDEKNPTSGGFSAASAGYASTTTLSAMDLENNAGDFRIIKGKLVSSSKEKISVYIYNIHGQVIKTFKNYQTDLSNSLPLELNRNTLYFVNIETKNGIKTIKTIF